MQWEDVPSGRTGFHINLFLSLEANLLQTFNFLFYRLLKNITKFCVVVLGLQPDFWCNYISQNKWNLLINERNVLKIFLIHVYQLSFLNISNTYRVFSNSLFSTALNIIYILLFHRVKRCCILIPLSINL